YSVKTVLKALDVLRHQLKQATKDLETLNRLKEKAMQEPFEFVSNLCDKQRRVPQLQRVVCVPEIDWNKYRFIPETRLAQKAECLILYQNSLDTIVTPTATTPTMTPTAKALSRDLARATQALRQVPSRAGSVSEESDKESDEEQSVQSGMGKGKGKRRTSMAQNGTQSPLAPQSPVHDVRYNEKAPSFRFRSIEPRLSEELSSTDDNKLATHNLPWSDEEQRRLEELLEIYPDEPVQAQRFNKISAALGTRTPRQVASRVQKYFIKLAKLGLPVPGRITIPPSCLPKSDRGGSHKAKSRHGKISKPKSKAAGNRARPAVRRGGSGYNAFVSGGLTNSRISGGYYSTSQAPPALLMSDEEDTDIKEAMLDVAKNSGKKVLLNAGRHGSFSCDGCGIEPIVGVRYKCTVCDVSEEIDLCSKCMAAGTFSNGLS
ncbi:uncharacterized protein BYT42DRAFT_496073, partial [Radiomyces spectabilis]|uniref:uncharacterized protein n=1 Tax=Radiomyces spectabilis TaxID=64574 RepID=UPI0022207808